MSGYVDVNAWGGAWPFGSGERSSISEVIADLKRVGVREAWISPLDAVLAAHPAMANAAMIAEATDLPLDEFVVRFAPIIDPMMADWKDQLNASREAAGDRLTAVRIVPTYHACTLDRPAVDDLAAALTDHGLPLIVQVRMLDERAHHPGMIVPPVPVAQVAALGRRHPDLRIIASGIFFSELGAIAETPNVVVELSSIETGDTLPDVLRVLPPCRILLGTHAPLYVPDAAVAKLDGEGIESGTLAAIGTGNARSLLRQSIEQASSLLMEGSTL